MWRIWAEEERGDEVVGDAWRAQLIQREWAGEVPQRRYVLVDILCVVMDLVLIDQSGVSKRPKKVSRKATHSCWRFRERNSKNGVQSRSSDWSKVYHEYKTRGEVTCI